MNPLSSSPTCRVKDGFLEILSLESPALKRKERSSEPGSQAPRLLHRPEVVLVHAMDEMKEKVIPSYGREAPCFRMWFGAASAEERGGPASKDEFARVLGFGA